MKSNEPVTQPDGTRVRSRGSQKEDSLLEPGKTCWRTARAAKMSLIVDAADYFRVLRDVFLMSRKELLLIGWDFDFEQEMLPGESDCDGLAPDGFPNKMGPFIEAVVEQAPDLHVYMLQWNGAIAVAPGAVMPSLALYVFGSDRIHFALDGHHPFGACHHQKIVVADNSLAFCGGIDATSERWDTSGHLPGDQRRKRPDGSLSGPWHDATSAMTGPAAEALGELSRKRWYRANGEELEKPEAASPIRWPEILEIHAQDVQVGIARTEPPYDEAPLINEIEQLYLRAIVAARKHIYIESQYFAAEAICEALESRLKEADGPEIVIVNPKEAHAQLEDDAMHGLRGRMTRRLHAADGGKDRFRIYYPVNSAGEPIYVHAKIMIVDDLMLRLGSSNLNDRSLGFDTECDVAVEAPAALITWFRARLISEHLDVSSEAFDRTLREEISLIAAIDRLNASEGRRLRIVEPEGENVLRNFLTNTRLLDPRYRPGQPHSAGKGVRPRHLAIVGGVALLAYLAWKTWSRRR